MKDRAGETVAGHFSVSVVNENIVPSDEKTEHTILTDLLLTSDLKGYVENPNYYFSNTSTKTLADLDLLMLTNGYRHFTWKKVLAGDNQPLAFQPEKGLEVTGIAQNISGKPLLKGAVSLISKRDGTFVSTTTNEQGHFEFKNLDFTDSTKFILQAVDAKGKNNTKIICSEAASPKVVPVIINDTIVHQIYPYVQNERKKQMEEANYGSIKGKMLKTVIVKDRKIENIPLSPTRWVSPEFADQVIKPEDMAKGGLFSDQLRVALHGVIVMKDNSGSNYVVKPGTRDPKHYHLAVILDGVVTDGDLDEITGLEVEDIEVLTSASRDVYGPIAANGILVINSKKNAGVRAKDVLSTGILPISPKGYYKAREFYAPKYDHPGLTDRKDLRSTIYWQPEITTGTDGKASLNYFDADTPGTYKVTIQGIDDNGNLGVQVYRYTVE